MLEAGDQGFTPSSETSRWRNDGERPTVIIATRITTLDEGLPPSGIARQLLVYDLAFVPPIPPFLLTVRRVTLSATAELAVDAVPGLRLLYVESGQLEARDSQPAATGAAQHTSPTTTKSFRVVNGAGVTRTFPSGRIFQAAGGDPVTLVLMTITDGNPLMVTPLG
jgi:hypothetical protein